MTPAVTPIVVMAHGLSGTRRDRLGPFAERFAAAGFAALLFDHRGFGDSGGEPDLFQPARQLDDWRAAIAFARSLPGVDPDRVATFGSSMGGGNALAAAADDPRIAAAISQVPFLDIVAPGPPLVAPGDGPHRCSRRSAAITCRPSDSRTRPAFINAPGGEAGWRHVVAIGEDSRWRNRVSARWLLGRPYRPAAPRRQAPLSLARLRRRGRPGRQARARRSPPHAARPHGELRTYPGVDHFDIYDGPEHEAVVADEIAFLRRHLF